MKTEKDIERKIASLFGDKQKMGFKKPPDGYFDQFSDSLNLEILERKKTPSRTIYQSNWYKVGSLAAAAILLMAVWLFVFDANINDGQSMEFTYEELIALNDFQQYNEELLYSEMANFEMEDIDAADSEVDALLNMGTLSSDDLIDFYINDDKK